MKTSLRDRVLAAVSAAYIAVVVWLFGEVNLATFNVLLVTCVVPMVWLIWVFCRFSAHQHANRWAKDIQTVQGGRPVPMPERAR